ncbi:MAG: HD domain-containing protein [Desulfosarcinaceae bacterium]|jgi:3'-5' exoribonuclease
MKSQYIGDLKAGQRLDDLFLLMSKRLSHKKDGNPYLTLRLGDRSGSLAGVVWDQVERISAAGQVGDVVHVQGQVGEFRDCLQVVVRHLVAQPAGSCDPADFLPATSRNREAMFERLTQLTTGITNPHLKALMERFWSDEAFVAAFKTAPAAKRMHHAYIGGLLEHTLSMALLCDRIGGHYAGIDMDLLLCGVILHDIGKTRELTYALGFDYSDEGRLLSHIIIGLEMVDAKIGADADFPKVLADLLKHLIVSHHGSRELGSPEPPKTIEALLLNHIDEIDSKVNAIRDFMQQEEGDGHWTAYHRLLERHFYKGPSGSENATDASTESAMAANRAAAKSSEAS